MSTLGGIYNFDGGPVDERLLSMLANALSNRGPDGGSECVRGHIAMVYRAFHTNKESSLESQPLVSSDGLVLCWDGRLDNRNDLIANLRGDLLEDLTDVAIIRASYYKWGSDFLPGVIGDFALALWDPRSRTLLLARDHAGPRTLFYHYDAERIIWSSELEPLLDLAGIKLEVNEEYVAGFLTLSLNPGITPYKEIHALPPGHVAIVRDGHLQVKRFWGFNTNYQLHYKTDEEYEEHFCQLFREAVRCRMRVSGPVWAQLSGGLDSSAIVCMADEILQKGEAQASRLESISFVYDQSHSSDERNFISCVEEKIGRSAHYIKESDYPPLALFPDQSQISFPDYIDCHFARHKALFELMEADGARVLLTGHGGDELLASGASPAPELKDLLIKRQLVRLHYALRAWSRQLKKPYVKLLWKEALVDLLPRSLRLAFAGPRSKLSPWLDEKFITRMSLQERRLNRYEDVFGFDLPSRRGQAIAYLSAIDMVCRASYRSRGGIEVSHPFLDRPLVEFLHAVPHTQKIRVGETRSLMRRALRGVLPEKVRVRRTKRGPDEAILRAVAREWPRLESMLADAHVDAYGYVDRKALLNSLGRARHGCQQTDIIKTICLELWLKAFAVRSLTAKRTAAAGASTSRNSAMHSRAVFAGQ